MKINTAQKGFTLLELLVVVAMIGILSSLAMVSYQRHIVQSNRQQARSALLLAQQGMEREFLRASTYAGAQLPAAQPNDPFVLNFPQNPTATTYIITATPNQPDVQCGALSIDQAGVRAALGTTNAQAVNDCWR